MHASAGENAKFFSFLLRDLDGLCGKYLRFFDKAGSIGWFIEPMYNPVNAILYQLHIPVYEKTKFYVLESHVGKQLCHVDRVDIIYRLILNNYQIIYQLIDSITFIELLSII